MTEAQIQLCGRLVVRLDGERVEDALPGTQGRLLFGYLALHRDRHLSRAQLAEAVWAERLPSAPDPALRALLSKLRTAVGNELIEGKAEIRLALPAGASIDTERAAEAIHNADSAVSQGDWRRAWVHSHVAVNVARRRFLAGLEAPWIDAERRALEEVQLRGLESRPPALASAAPSSISPSAPLAR